MIKKGEGVENKDNRKRRAPSNLKLSSKSSKTSKDSNPSESRFTPSYIVRWYNYNETRTFVELIKNPHNYAEHLSESGGKYSNLYETLVEVERLTKKKSEKSFSHPPKIPRLWIERYQKISFLKDAKQWYDKHYDSDELFIAWGKPEEVLTASNTITAQYWRILCDDLCGRVRDPLEDIEELTSSSSLPSLVSSIEVTVSSKLPFISEEVPMEIDEDDVTPESTRSSRDIRSTVVAATTAIAASSTQDIAISDLDESEDSEDEPYINSTSNCVKLSKSSKSRKNKTTSKPSATTKVKASTTSSSPAISSGFVDIHMEDIPSSSNINTTIAAASSTVPPRRSARQTTRVDTAAATSSSSSSSITAAISHSLEDYDENKTLDQF